MRALLTCLVLIAVAACGRGREPAADPKTDPYKGLELLQAMGKPNFTLTDLDGHDFNFRHETDGYLTLLFFGYTNCPDVCPLHMANIGAVLRAQPPEVWAVKLAVELSDTTRDMDLGRKAKLYARHNVPEYWVADRERQVLMRHSAPGADGYAKIMAFAFGEIVGQAVERDVGARDAQ